MITPEDDIDRIMAVMATAFDPTFGEAWTRRQVSDALMFGNCRYQLIDQQGNASTEGVAVGFALTRDGYGEEELLLLAVDPSWRRRGLGQMMLAALIENARTRGAGRVLLEMRRGNPAERLYLACGFVAVGHRANYYLGGGGQRIDAVTFARSIE